jgi:3-dehydroshikimate dehydratase
MSKTKFSFCSIAWRHKSLSLEDMIHIVAMLGYDGIEIWGKHLWGYETKLDSIKKLLDSSEIEVAMISPYFDFTSSKERWRKSILDFDTYLHIANRLDCKLIRCFTGKVGSDFATAKEWNSCVEGFKIIAEKAMKFSVKIAIETHIHTLADRKDSIKKLLDDLRSENVGVTLDLYNLFEIGEDPYRLVEDFNHNIFHFHFKNAEKNLGTISPFNYVLEKNREIIGIRNLFSGDLDYHRIMNQIRALDYEGFISIECFETRRNPIRFAKDEISFLRNIMRNNADRTSAESFANEKKVIERVRN